MVVAQVQVHLLFDGILDLTCDLLKVVVVVVVVVRIGLVVVVLSIAVCVMLFVVVNVSVVLVCATVVAYLLVVVVVTGRWFRLLVVVKSVGSVANLVGERSWGFVTLKCGWCFGAVDRDLYGGMHRLFWPKVTNSGAQNFHLNMNKCNQNQKKSNICERLVFAISLTPNA